MLSQNNPFLFRGYNMSGWGCVGWTTAIRGHWVGRFTLVLNGSNYLNWNVWLMCHSQWEVSQSLGSATSKSVTSYVWKCLAQHKLGRMVLHCGYDRDSNLYRALGICARNNGPIVPRFHSDQLKTSCVNGHWFDFEPPEQQQVKIKPNVVASQHWQSRPGHNT